MVGDLGSSWKKFLRVRVEIPIDKPLLPGFFLPRPNKSDIWIGFKFEKLADFCYKCGIIGHEERSCKGNIFQLCNTKGTSFKAASPWLRAGNDDIPPDVFLCTEVLASTSDSTEPLPIHTQVVTNCPVLAAQKEGTCAATYYTIPKDDMVSTILHQTWQDHATPTTPEPPGKSTNAKVHSQAVPELGPKRSTKQHSVSTKPNEHASPSTSNQLLGLRNLFRLTPVKVGLKPMNEPSALSPPSQNITSESFDTSLPRTNSKSLKSSPNPFSSPQRDTITTTPYTNLSTVQAQPKDFTQSPWPSLSKTLKRKITEEENVNFAKRLRMAASGPKPVFFDPDTVSLITQSRLEQFILQERQKSEDEGNARKYFSYLHSHPCIPNYDNSCSTTIVAKEAGLIMPPPSP